MKRVLCVFIFSVFALSVFGQATTVDAAKKELQGTWLSHGDSISELLITSDSITTFRFKLNGVTRCTYKLQSQPCEKQVKFPAGTGIYIVENYGNTTWCCSLAAISPTSIKIIYPNGYEVVYANESTYMEGVK